MAMQHTLDEDQVTVTRTVSLVPSYVGVDDLEDDLFGVMSDDGVDDFWL